MKTINKPDLNAPRFREKYTSVLNEDTFKAFKKKHPEHKALTLLEFRKIVMTFNSELVQGVISNRNGIELPEGLGFIFMATCPPAKHKNIDYIRSVEYGVNATYKNWDTDNNLMKIFYTNCRARQGFQNKKLWAFRASKPVRKAMSNAYKENWTMYLRVKPNEKISRLFDQQRHKEYVQNLKPVIPEDYDEFKI